MRIRVSDSIVAVLLLAPFTAGAVLAQAVPDSLLGRESMAAAAAVSSPEESADSRAGVASAPGSATSGATGAGEPSQPQAQQSTPVAPGTSVTILGSGDILIHRELWQQAQADGAQLGGAPTFTPALSGIAARVAAADLAICHLEYPIAEPGQTPTFWPDLPASPPEIADGIASVGFDTCSVSSNHTLDQGFAGVQSTLAALEASGLKHAGAARTPAEAEVIRTYEVNGVRIAHLAATYSYNGMPIPTSAPWCCPELDAQRLVEQAVAARSAGAAIVIVSLHHGVEGMAEPSADQMAVIDVLARSGSVDLVLGHHAHVVSPVQKVGDMWVVYGHGNLLTAQSRRDPRSADGLLTTFTFVADAQGRMAVSEAVGIPVLNTDFPFRLHDLSALAGARSEREEASFRRTSEAVMSLDAEIDGFRIATS